MTVGAMKRFAIVLALLFLSLYPVFAHEGMRPIGRFDAMAGSEYLHGMNREDPNLNVINCCRHGGDGDCHLTPLKDVKIVPGGYRLADGEFIPEREATVSPDENFYRCIHVGKVSSHCFFVPARGF